jgi:hypothetical protein
MTKSSGFFRITNHSNFGVGRSGDKQKLHRSNYTDNGFLYMANYFSISGADKNSKPFNRNTFSFYGLGSQRRNDYAF